MTDSALRWVAGVYFFNQDRFRSLATTFLGTPVPPAAQDLKLENYAAFGNLSYDLTEDLELTLAFRYDVETPEDTTQGRSETFRELQPKASLAYKFREDSARLRDGRQGLSRRWLQQPRAGQQFPARFRQGITGQLRAGLKGLCLRRSTAHAGSACFISTTPTSSFSCSTRPAPRPISTSRKSRILGGELEIVATPTDALQFDIGLGFTDSEITEYADIPGVLVPASAIVGSNVPGAPVWTLNLGLQHTAALTGSLDLVSRLDYEHRGKTYWTLDNVDTQSAYDLVNLSLALEKDTLVEPPVCQQPVRRRIYRVVFRVAFYRPACRHRLAQRAAAGRRGVFVPVLIRYVP